MKYFIKEYPYYSVAILLIILKIFGIINWSWWIITLPIYWWWPIFILASIFAISYILIEDLIRRFKT
jgi:hypothetical protein